MVLTAGAALLRFLTLCTQSYWYDEAITVELVRRPFHAMLGTLPHSESTPPLYYVLAWIWSRVLGTGETGLRSLSAVPEARRGPPLAAWAIVASLALTTHYFALFLVLAEAIWLVRHSLEKRAAAIAVAAVAAVAGALAPLAAYQARYSQHTAWISNAGGVGSRAEYLLHQLVVGPYPASHIRPLIAALPVLVLVGIFAWTDRAERAGALVMLWFGLAAIGAPAVLALLGDKFFGGRAATTSSIAT